MRAALFLNHYNKGFTVLELLVTVSLVGILAGVATLGFQQIRESYARMDVLTTFSNDISLARLQAVSEGGRGILVISADGTGYSFGFDYLEYDVTAPIQYDSGVLTALQFTTELPDGFTVTVTDNSVPPVNTPIIFDSKGKVIDEFGLLRSHLVTFYQNGVLYKTASVTPGGAATFIN